MGLICCTGLVDMLNQMRVGVVEPATAAQFMRLARPLLYDDGIEPTQMSAYRMC